MSAREAAVQAVCKAMRAWHGSMQDEALPHLVAAAVDAYERERPIESVVLLSPAPGDTVFFRVRGMDTQEFDEFSQSLEPFRRQHPGVLFAAAEVEDVTIVRPQIERTGLDRLREVANRVVSREEFDEITTKGEDDDES